ncbi:hypothetical protein Tco_1217166 [Tanacetum coccineum]
MAAVVDAWRWVVTVLVVDRDSGGRWWGRGVRWLRRSVWPGEGWRCCCGEMVGVAFVLAAEMERVVEARWRAGQSLAEGCRDIMSGEWRCG